MDKPLVTVMTPSYNRAHTLHRVFESLKHQTFKNFEWIIIDDGSTDDTQRVVEGFIENSDLNIRYYQQENEHKFITFFKGVDLAEGKYFSPADSDDAFLPNALEILVNTWEQLERDDIVFVLSLCQDEEGKLVGDKFPKDPLISSIFDMRYKFRVKGDKWGMGKTAVYKKMSLDFDRLRGKGFIPEGVFQFQFDQQGKHYCINQTTRIYIRDAEDGLSLANQFYDDKNAFGLAEAYKAFINIYSDKWLTFPKVLFRNLIGYLIYSAKDKRSYAETVSEIQPLWAKCLSGMLYPMISLIKNKL